MTWFNDLRSKFNTPRNYSNAAFGQESYQVPSWDRNFPNTNRFMTPAESQNLSTTMGNYGQQYGNFGVPQTTLPNEMQSHSYTAPPLSYNGFPANPDSNVYPARPANQLPAPTPDPAVDVKGMDFETKANLGLKGVGTLGSLYFGMKGLEAAEKARSDQMKMWNTNRNDQLAQIKKTEDRWAARSKANQA